MHCPLLLTLNAIRFRQVWFIFSFSQTQTQLYSHQKYYEAWILNYTRENGTAQLVQGFLLLYKDGCAICVLDRHKYESYSRMMLFTKSLKLQIWSCSTIEHCKKVLRPQLSIYEVQSCRTSLPWHAPTSEHCLSPQPTAGSRHTLRGTEVPPPLRDVHQDWVQASTFLAQHWYVRKLFLFTCRIWTIIKTSAGMPALILHLWKVSKPWIIKCCS